MIRCITAIVQSNIICAVIIYFPHLHQLKLCLQEYSPSSGLQNMLTNYGRGTRPKTLIWQPTSMTVSLTVSVLQGLLVKTPQKESLSSNQQWGRSRWKNWIMNMSFIRRIFDTSRETQYQSAMVYILAERPQSIGQCYSLNTATEWLYASRQKSGTFIRSRVTNSWINICSRRLAFQAMQNLHAAGINHGNITSSHHLLLYGGGLRLISFSRAKRHKCCPNRNGPGLFCEELIESEREFGALQDRENITELLQKVTMSADHATRWGFHSHKEIIQWKKMT